MSFIFLCYLMWKKTGTSAPPEVSTVLLKHGIRFETKRMGARRKAVSHACLEHREMSAASDSSLALQPRRG